VTHEIVEAIFSSRSFSSRIRSSKHDLLAGSCTSNSLPEIIFVETKIKVPVTSTIQHEGSNKPVAKCLVTVKAAG
jgi:hypothetical protein